MPPILEHDYPVTSVAYSRDGVTFISSDYEGVLVLWNARTREELDRTARHSGPATCVATSPREEIIASGGVDGIVRLWAISDGKLDILGSLQGHAGTIQDLAFSSDGKRLASSGNDNTFRLWDVASRSVLDTFRGSAPAVALTFAPGGEVLARASYDGIKLLSLTERRFPDVLTDPTAAVCFTAFSPDETTFVAGGWDRMVRLWDTKTWRLRKVLPHTKAVFCLAISPDGKTLATAGAGRIIRLWDLENLDTRPVELDGHPGVIWSVAFSPDGRTLVSAGGSNEQGKNGTVRLWDVPSQAEIVECRYDGHPSAARMAIFSPHGTSIASGSVDGTVRVWNPITRQELFRATAAKGLWSVAFSPDGQMLAATAGRTAKIWDLATREARTLQDDTAVVMHVAFLPPDGKTLMTAGHEGTVRLWDSETGTLRFSCPTSATGVNYFAFSQDGKTIALCCRDATIRLLRAASEEDVRAAGWYGDL